MTTMEEAIFELLQTPPEQLAVMRFSDPHGRGVDHGFSSAVRCWINVLEMKRREVEGLVGSSTNKM